MSNLETEVRQLVLAYKNLLDMADVAPTTKERTSLQLEASAVHRVIQQKAA